MPIVVAPRLRSGSLAGVGSRGLWIVVRVRAGIAGLLAVGMVCPAAPLFAEWATPAAPAAGGEARPPLIPVATFAQRDLFANPTMSPDGAGIAVYVESEGKSGIKVLDSSTRKSLAAVVLQEDMEYGWHRWAGSDIVLISVSQAKPFMAGEEMRASRLVALKVSTGTTWLVGPKQMGPEGDDLLHVAKDGSSVLLSFQETLYDWPSVARISLLDPKDRGEQVQGPVRNVWEWYADDQGVVRMGTGWSDGKLQVRYRKSEGEKLRVVARIGEEEEEEEKFWQVSRIIGGSDEALLLKEDKDGRTILARYDLATRQKLETIYRNENWDVTDAWLDDSGKPYAVDFTDDRDRRVWLEPAMAKLQAQFEKALKYDEVWVGSHSRDKSRMLVFVGGESDPGGYFVYDAKRRALNHFADLRPGLDHALLARPTPVSYTARDGTKIAAYLTLPRGRAPKGLPLIVMPHGGPYGVRDKLRYDDQVQFLANRGYAVLQPNYRGSGGYGSAFEDKGHGQIGRAMQDDIDDAMDWAVKQGFAAADRVCVIGASYGGYAAMWSVLRNPERYRCAASFAGVTDWAKLLRYDAKFFSRKRAKTWKTRVTGESGFDLDTVAPTHTMGKLTRPLLVAHGKRDTRVPFSQYKLLLAAAEKAGVKFDRLVFEEAGHGFEKPEDEARWLNRLEAFLKAHNPAE